MPDPTHGFQGRFLFVKEVTRGVTPTNPAYKRLSDSISDLKVSLDVGTEGFRSIDSFDVVDFLTKSKKPGYQVTYRLQRGDPLIDMLTRKADGTCESYSAEIAQNKDTTGAKLYLTFEGAKHDVEINAKANDYIVVTLTAKAELLVAATAEPNLGTGTREGAIGTAFATYKGAVVTKGGSAWGAVTEGFSVKVDNGLDWQPQLGSENPAYVYEGARKVSGKGDVFLADAGYAYFGEVDAGTASTIVLKCGAVSSGLPQLTMTGCVFPKLELTADDKTGTVKHACAFDAKTVAAVAL